MILRKCWQSSARYTCSRKTMNSDGSPLLRVNWLSLNVNIVCRLEVMSLSYVFRL